MLSKHVPCLPLVFLLRLLSFVSADCPTTSAAGIPGCWGEPECAYVIAPGNGQVCDYDYCNCGGVAAPLLPTTIDNTTTVGCDYTTVPAEEECPTGPISIPTGANRDPGATDEGVTLAAPLTTGGPISTAADAFKTDAPTVTTLPYQGGALTYTLATFTSLASQEDTKTITATVTKTGIENSALETFVGPIVVGPKGIFWGPPGTAPSCVWPFCTQSGPPSSGGNKGGGVKGGGGGGGAFGCQDCAGGGGRNGPGGGSNGGNNSDNADNNGGDDDDDDHNADNDDDDNNNDNNEEGSDDNNNNSNNDNNENDENDDNDKNNDNNEEPLPEACPGAKKVKRDPSFTLVSGRIVKRAEEIITSTNPLKDALGNFGKDNQGNNLASAAIDTADGILTNKFPQGRQNAYVTGLEGHYTLPQKTTIGTGDNQQTFQSGERLFWRIRWDFDPQKGPHVNGHFGTKPPSKFAYSLDSSRWPEQGDNGAKKAMNRIVKDMNSKVKYEQTTNEGKNQPTWDTTEKQAIEDLKNYFKAVANGPC